MISYYKKNNYIFATKNGKRHSTLVWWAVDGVGATWQAHVLGRSRCPGLQTWLYVNVSTIISDLSICEKILKYGNVYETFWFTYLYICLHVWEYCDSQMQYLQARILNHIHFFLILCRQIQYKLPEAHDFTELTCVLLFLTLIYLFFC